MRGMYFVDVFLVRHAIAANVERLFVGQTRSALSAKRLGPAPRKKRLTRKL